MAWLHLHGDRTDTRGTQTLSTHEPLGPRRWQSQQSCRAYAHHRQPQQHPPVSSSAAHKGMQTKGREGGGRTSDVQRDKLLHWEQQYSE